MFFGFVAYRTHPTLLAQHLLVSRRVDTRRAPLALLEVMRVAKAFGVCVVIARVNGARIGGCLAVTVHGVPVSQQPLVVHLAQALGLYRLSAAVLGALVGLYGDANLDRSNGCDAPLELHVMCLTVAASLVRSAAALHRAGVVFFAHKKTPIGGRSVS